MTSFILILNYLHYFPDIRSSGIRGFSFSRSLHGSAYMLITKIARHPFHPFHPFYHLPRHLHVAWYVTGLKTCLCHFVDQLQLQDWFIS